MKKELFVICGLGLCSAMDTSAMDTSVMVTNPRNFKVDGDSVNIVPGMQKNKIPRSFTTSALPEIVPGMQRNKRQRSFTTSALPKVNETLQANFPKEDLQSEVSLTDSQITLVPSSHEVSLDVVGIIEPKLSLEIRNGVSSVDLFNDKEILLKITSNIDSNLKLEIKTDNTWKAVLENDPKNAIFYHCMLKGNRCGNQRADEVNSFFILDVDYFGNNECFLTLNFKPDEQVSKSIMKAGVYRDHVTISVSTAS